MLTVKLIGGLGNQMFQYAVGKCLSIKLNCNLFLCNQHFNYSNRKNELGIFNIKIINASLNEKPFYEITLKNKILDNLWQKLIFLFKKINPNHIIENPYHPIIWKGMYNFNTKIIELKKKNLYLEGFWQSEKYFKEIEDIIRKDFTLITPIQDNENIEIIEKMKNTNSVSIHVRRGDYLGSYFGGICEKEYYQKAIKLIQNKINNPIYFIFSEDTKWCIENLKPGNETYFIDWNTGNNSYKDMILMSTCKHNIMANSTFSWWGAWLNNNKEKIVIAPKKWHQNLDYKDIIPDNWIRI